jgi:hypothetical protein
MLRGIFLDTGAQNRRQGSQRHVPVAYDRMSRAEADLQAGTGGRELTIQQLRICPVCENPGAGFILSGVFFPICAAPSV